MWHWLPRTRGDRPNSPQLAKSVIWATPHTRGSTRASGSDGQPIWGYPAHAGIDPALPLRRYLLEWLPRTRGDRPAYDLLYRLTTTATPHTRGSTYSKSAFSPSYEGYPAHAGIDRKRRSLL